MSLGLGTSLLKGGLTTPGIVTDSLVLKHNYAAGGVVPVSDGAAYFDGSNAEINMGSDSSLDVGVNQFSATCWFNPSVIGTNFIMGKGVGLAGPNYDGLGWACTIYSGTSKINFDIYAGTHGGSPEDIRLQITAPDVLPSANRWYHLAVTRETSGVDSIFRIYIDGVNVVSTTAANGGAYDALDAAGIISDASNNFTIGENNVGEHDFTGYICNVG